MTLLTKDKTHEFEVNMYSKKWIDEGILLMIISFFKLSLWLEMEPFLKC